MPRKKSGKRWRVLLPLSNHGNDEANPLHPSSSGGSSSVGSGSSEPNDPIENHLEVDSEQETSRDSSNSNNLQGLASEFGRDWLYSEDETTGEPQQKRRKFGIKIKPRKYEDIEVVWECKEGPPLTLGLNHHDSEIIFKNIQNNQDSEDDWNWNDYDEDEEDDQIEIVYEGPSPSWPCQSSQSPASSSSGSISSV